MIIICGLGIHWVVVFLGKKCTVAGGFGFVQLMLAFFPISEGLAVINAICLISRCK